MTSVVKKIKIIRSKISINKFKKWVKLLICGDVRSLALAFNNLILIINEKKKSLPLKTTLASFYYLPKVEALNINEPIDIIIPIYNGYEFLSGLFTSLYHNTDIPYRLIIIDDCSTDQRVVPFLKQINNQFDNTELLFNEENLGFVKTVNIGIKHTNNHFVILNSDTIVPKKWLQRLMFPICHLKKVASTTPFTNSGTICSFPCFLEDNDIFEGMEIDLLDTFFQQVNSSNRYFEMPTGVGFCLGINKHAVKKIGLFDQETFHKGYGEENDWCIRAKKAGYKNVIVPNLFVYHKHAGSFKKEEKKELSDENLNKLLVKHPHYLLAVQNYIKKDPCRSIREFLVILAASNDKSKPILLIDHELGGGANQFSQNKVNEWVQSQRKVFKFTYDFKKQTYYISFLYKQYNYLFTFENLIEFRMLQEFIFFDEVYLNDLVSFPDPLEFLLIIKDLKVKNNSKVVIYCHDYFLICPSFVLLNHKKEFCGLPELSQCVQCLAKNSLELYPKLKINIEKWREGWGSILTISDEIICFSHSSKQIIKQVYPFLDDQKVFVKPHTVDYLQPIRREKTNFDTKTIGILGTINIAKGFEIVKEMVGIIDKKRLKVRIVVIGEIQEKCKSPNLTVIGKYKKEELPNLVEKYKVDLFFLPSIGPETFSFTTEEVIKMDLPIAVFDLGAPAERVRNYRHGLIIEKINPEYAINKLLDYMNDNL